MRRTGSRRRVASRGGIVLVAFLTLAAGSSCSSSRASSARDNGVATDATTVPAADAPGPRRLTFTLDPVGQAGYKGGSAVTVGTEIWLANPGSAQLVMFDPATGSETTLSSDGSSAISSIGGTAYVGETNAGSPRVRQVDIATHVPGLSVSVPSTPRSLASVDGRIWVLTAKSASAPFASSVVSVLDPETMAVTRTIDLDGYQGAMVAAGGTVLFVGQEATGGVQMVAMDPETGTITDRVTVPGNVDPLFTGFALAATDDDIYVGTFDSSATQGIVSRFHKDGLASVGTYSTRDEVPSGLTVTQDGFLLVSTSGASMLTGTDTSNAGFSLRAFDLRADPAKASQAAGIATLSGGPGTVALIGSTGYLPVAGGSNSPLYAVTWVEAAASDVQNGISDAKSAAEAVIEAANAGNPTIDPSIATPDGFSQLIAIRAQIGKPLRIDDCTASKSSDSPKPPAQATDTCHGSPVDGSAGGWFDVYVQRIGETYEVIGGGQFHGE